MIGDGMGKAVDLSVQFRRHWFDAQPLKGINQGMSKAVQSVAVFYDAFALHIVEHFPYLFGRKFVMIEKRNKASDGALEVDIVLPQRVVCVDQKNLRAGHATQSTRASGPMIPALWPISSKRRTASAPSAPKS